MTQQELLYRLGWFTRVRWVMAGLAGVMLLGAINVLGVRFLQHGRPTVWPAAIIVAGFFVGNALYVIVHGRLAGMKAPPARDVRALALAQIMVDLAGVCLLVHYTGGVENFFLLLVLLPIVIATELLSRPLALAVAALAAIGVNVLVWGEYSAIIPHVAIAWPGRADGVVVHADRYYLLVYTLAVTATIFVTAAIASSITARLRHREDQLEQAYDMLRQADESKSFFMRKAGHEMRAPLAAIYSILDALQDVSFNLPVEQTQLLARARVRLRALMAMVDDLRRYSRLRAHEQITSRGKVNLGELAAATVDLFRPQAGEAGIELDSQVGAVSVAGDEELLRELVTNLIANAIQYTLRGGSILVVLAAAEGQAVLSVMDTGIGISVQAREHLFEDFYRAPEARQMFAAGTGLGLAICKHIVEMHGGLIEAIGRPGGGTEFRVTLQGEVQRSKGP